VHVRPPQLRVISGPPIFPLSDDLFDLLLNLESPNPSGGGTGKLEIILTRHGQHVPMQRTVYLDNLVMRYSLVIFYTATTVLQSSILPIPFYFFYFFLTFTTSLD
jgi:hypothetical protein